MELASCARRSRLLVQLLDMLGLLRILVTDPHLELDDDVASPEVYPPRSAAGRRLFHVNCFALGEPGFDQEVADSRPNVRFGSGRLMPFEDRPCVLNARRWVGHACILRNISELPSAIE